MAHTESESIKAKLFTSRVENKALMKAVAEYMKKFGEASALLYSPRACWLAKLESGGGVVASCGKEKQPTALTDEDLQSVYEARVFNARAELRWLNQADGSGAAVVLCADDERDFFGAKPVPYKTKIKNEEKDLVDSIKQTYLLWGQSVAIPSDADTPSEIVDGWTQFAEARVGSFFVPLKISAPNKRAQFTAYEYFGEYEDGNVAVAEERLTGIEIA